MLDFNNQLFVYFLKITTCFDQIIDHQQMDIYYIHYIYSQQLYGMSHSGSLCRFKHYT
jgi:hypothetical protein